MKVINKKKNRTMKIGKNIKSLIKVAFVLGLFISFSGLASAQGLFQKEQASSTQKAVETGAFSTESSGSIFGGSKQSSSESKNSLRGLWDDEEILDMDNKTAVPVSDGAVALLLLSFGYLAVRAVKSRQSRA